MAESICEDILATEPDNRQALVTMILAVTDQFRDHGVGEHTARARALIPRLTEEYERLYYAGYHLRATRPRAPGARPARRWADRARLVRRRHEPLRTVDGRPPNRSNDDPVLRWNACARTLNHHPELQQQVGEPAPSVAPDW